MGLRLGFEYCYKAIVFTGWQAARVMVFVRVGGFYKDFMDSRELHNAGPSRVKTHFSGISLNQHGTVKGTL